MVPNKSGCAFDAARSQGKTPRLCNEAARKQTCNVTPASAIVPPRLADVQVKATHLLRTKKTTSATTTTAPMIPPISGQFIVDFSSKLAVME